MGIEPPEKSRLTVKELGLESSGREIDNQRARGGKRGGETDNQGMETVGPGQKQPFARCYGKSEPQIKAKSLSWLRPNIKRRCLAHRTKFKKKSGCTKTVC